MALGRLQGPVVIHSSQYSTVAATVQYSYVRFYVFTFLHLFGWWVMGDGEFKFQIFNYKENTVFLRFTGSFHAKPVPRRRVLLYSSARY